MTSDPGQAPKAQGDLSKNPFAHLILYAHREQLDGTLVVEHRGYEVRVLFKHGRAVAGYGLPRGAALQEGLLDLCAATEGAFGFWEADRVGTASGVVRGTVDPYTFVTESLRAHVREDVIASVLDRYRGVPLRADASCDPARYGLRGAEARFVEKLRTQPRTPEELGSMVELNPERARRLMYLLLVTKACSPEVGDAAAGPTSASGVRNAVTLTPQRGSQPGMPAVTLEGSVRPPVGSARPPSGAPRPASGQPPQGSMRPQSFSPPRGMASIPAWQQIAAWRAASSAAPPTPSAPVRAPTPSMAPPPVETLDDSGKLRRAEQMLERRNLVEASRILGDLAERNPQDAEVASLQAWALYQQWSSDRPPRELLDCLERALKHAPENPRALYVKALVLRKMGRENDALRHFLRVLQADPKHVDAMRELRLAKMRRGPNK